MTQPAKVQEPSMEEILASIRRIIADDEAKPADAKPVDVKPAAEKPATPAPSAKPEPAAKAPAMKDIPPSAIAPKPAAAAPKAAPAPKPVASNNQDDIDSMLASLDAATPEPLIRPAPSPGASSRNCASSSTSDSRMNSTRRSLRGRLSRIALSKTNTQCTWRQDLSAWYRAALSLARRSRRNHIRPAG